MQKHLEYRSLVDNEVFDLVDLRKVKPRNYVDRKMGAHHHDRQTRELLQGKGKMGIERFQDKQKEYQQTESPASTRLGFRISCQMAASQRCYIFHIYLETAFFQAQSHGVNRDVVSQLPPEAGHPPHVAARLKKPAYGMNDAPRRWWNILDKKLCSCGMVPTRADRCCMCCTQPKRVSTIGTERVIHRGMIHMPSHLNRVCDRREMQHLRECWIPLKEAQLQTNPSQEP